jgi:hypothetical protein
VKSDKGCLQTCPPLSLLPYTTLRYIVPFVVTFVVFNEFFYLVTTIVVLLAGAKAADKATSGTRHLPDQGAAASRDDCLASRRSRGLGCDVRVVDVPGIQSHLRAELAEPTEQAVGAPLQGG